MSAHQSGAPLVTVLLPVFNGGDFLRLAVESILVQSHRDLEVLVLDDGSTDGALTALEPELTDLRVRVLRHPNRGLPATLNRGIDEARGSLIARMDADDVAHPRRIERQVAAMAADPDLVLVGGQVNRLIGTTAVSTTHLPLDHSGIVTGLRRRSHVLCHPAVMFRTAEVRAAGGYWNVGTGEDWDLFLRLAELGALANLPDVVLDYRFHEGGINASGMRRLRRNMMLATVNDARRRRGRPALSDDQFSPLRFAPAHLKAGMEACSLAHYRRALALGLDGARSAERLHLAAAAAWWPEQALRRLLPRFPEPQRRAIRVASAEDGSWMTEQAHDRPIAMLDETESALAVTAAALKVIGAAAQSVDSSGALQDRASGSGAEEGAPHR